MKKCLFPPEKMGGSNVGFVLKNYDGQKYFKSYKFNLLFEEMTNKKIGEFKDSLLDEFIHKC